MIQYFCHEEEEIYKKKMIQIIVVKTSKYKTNQTKHIEYNTLRTSFLKVKIYADYSTISNNENEDIRGLYNYS